MSKKIKIICFYDNIMDMSENRYTAQAAQTKLECIIADLIYNNIFVEIVSMSATRGLVGCKSHLYNLNEKSTLRLFKCFGRKNFFTKKTSFFLMRIQLIMYMILNIKKNDNVLVYHSLGYDRIIKVLKKIIGFYLILEVEEIYGDVLQQKKVIERELSYFKIADAYIFPTVLLNKLVNTSGKPFVIIHGTYSVKEKITNGFNDNFIHCVYAGTFDARKGGVVAAIRASAYLNEKYHMHIIGFGSEEETDNVTELIADVSSNSRCKITYDGLLKGDDYIKFIQSCSIGLSTQSPEAEFNATSFPSKVLSYFANGLNVVSIRIEALETSDVAHLINFYEDNKPESIAKAIRDIQVDGDFDSRKEISKLNDKFIKEIKALVK